MSILTFNNDISEEVGLLEKRVSEEGMSLAEITESVLVICENYEERFLGFLASKGDSFKLSKDTHSLHRLANLLMIDYISDKRADKVGAEEFPFLTDAQLSRRIYGVHERLRHGGYKQIEFDPETIGSDLQDYGFPTKSYLPLNSQIKYAMKGKSGNVKTIRSRRKNY